MALTNIPLLLVLRRLRFVLHTVELPAIALLCQPANLQGEVMTVQYPIGTIALTVALAARPAGGQPVDKTKYPVLDGQ
jgi:hypothetical protein